MSSSTNSWVKYVVPGLFVVMLLALSYTSYSFSTSLQKTTATMEAVATRAESALAVAQTSEATQADAMKTPVARVEAAVAAAETAVAAAPTTSAPAPTGPVVPLDGGVGITYQTATGYDMALYPVDDWALYMDYAEFEAEWALQGPATVRLALLETQEGSGEWQLFHAEPIADTEVTPTGWSEYALSVEFHLAGTEEGGTGSEPGLVDGELVFDEGPGQKIVTSIPFTVEPGSTTGHSLFSLEDVGADPNSSSRLLLADSSTGKTKYILIIFDPDYGAGGDWIRRWCSRCRAGWCRNLCRRRH